ncbi:MAG: PhzF family phenazine biosynthesis protein [Chloroflexi bacterium]|nr:PhzF family phenazine biosynthesis protein [Chloroflexota bacterium]
MNILKIAAFSHQGQGGNPAGVVFNDKMPEAAEMLKVAKQVGYSETAFLSPQDDGWRVRYFAPEREVPFCGHATIASGAALGERFGEGTYKLYLNDSEISVSAERSADENFAATLQSPETWSKDAPREYVDRVLAAFHLNRDQLDYEFPVRFAFAGAKHLVIAVTERKILADMKYEFEMGKALMAEEDLVTISVIWRESDEVFHSRNAFASGGVYEDPATGAAAAALAGYLRDINWQGKKSFMILQGEDMGMPSRLLVRYSSKTGESVSVSGEVRHISD